MGYVIFGAAELGAETEATYGDMPWFTEIPK